MSDVLLSRLLADFICNTRGTDLPAPIRAKAADHALDTLGAMLAGGAASETQRATAMLQAAGETGTVPLAGQQIRLAPRAAALVNGIAAHAYELDDTIGCDHSGAVVWPAILSVLACADRPVSGEDVLTAMVLGYDIGRRVMLGFGGYKAHNGAGWHSTGTCGTFAAAAASAHLMKLDPLQTQAALGLAGGMASGNWSFIHDGAMSKKLNAGHAAQAGLTAALLARQGMTGPTAIFENVWGGLFRTYGGAGTPDTGTPNAGRADPAMTAGLGRDWMLSVAAIKPHASCRDVHAAVDAVARLQARENIRPAEIRHIRARLSPFLIGMVGGSQIDTLARAQMSLPYGIAAQLHCGTAGLSAYSEEMRRNADVLDLLARVEIVEDSGVANSWDASVEIALADGRVFEEPTTIPLGAPENPLSAAALRGKFDGLAGTVLSEDRVRALGDMALGLSVLDDARALPAMLLA